MHKRGYKLSKDKKIIWDGVKGSEKIIIVGTKKVRDFWQVQWELEWNGRLSNKETLCCVKGGG